MVAQVQVPSTMHVEKGTVLLHKMDQVGQQVANEVPENDYRKGIQDWQIGEGKCVALPGQQRKEPGER